MFSEIRTPTIAIIKDITEGDWSVIKTHLTYKDSSVEALINNHARNFHWKRTNKSTWELKRDQLNLQLVKLLYTVVDNHTIKYRPALSSYFLREDQIQSNSILFPPLDETYYKWVHPLPYPLRPYQETSIRLLLKAKHAHVELTTGMKLFNI